MIVLLLTVFFSTIAMYLNRCYSDQNEQKFYSRFNQIPENPNPKDEFGLSLANLPVDEKKEIQEIVKKALEGQYLYRFCHKNEEEMDELIESLYISSEYQNFKEEYKKEYKSQCNNISLEEILSSLEKIRFSKIWKYENLNDRIGIVAGPESGNIHSFLFKKINNLWRIEKEKFAMIKYYFDEHSAAKEILEQEKNETRR